MRLLAVATWSALLAACSDPDAPPPPAPSFPADYAASYVEVRGCRKSADHELEHVRVLADAAAAEPYVERAGAFPEGAVVLKEQYDPSDTTCSGPIVQWTAMRKTSAATEHLGWAWQRVDAERRVLETNQLGCSTCHQACTGASNAGYDATCADP
jgi:hypothetical protein